MTMLKNRMLLKALIHEIPGLAYCVGRQINKDLEPLLKEVQNIYRQLGIYDNIIDRIKLGGVI